MATLFPENVVGLHSNFLKVITPVVIMKTFIASYFPQFFVDDPKYIRWIFPQKPKLIDLLQETGYLHIQGVIIINSHNLLFKFNPFKLQNPTRLELQLTETQ